MVSTKSLHAAAALLCAVSASPLAERATNTAVVNLNNNTGSTAHLASGILYGIPDKANQIPSHFYSDIGFNYFRGGGAQVPAPGRGWIWGTTEYKNRFASALSNYKTAVQNGGKVIFLIHDLWGADGSQNSSAPYPGDNGNWASWDSYLNQWISDMNANGATSNLIVDIWNEPDLSIFWGRSQDQYLQMWTRTYNRLRQAWGTNVLISGPASANTPSAGNTWWKNYMSTVSSSGTIPDQWAWHMEGGGGDLLSTYGGLVSLLNNYKLPMRPVNINEYATLTEEAPPGSAWWIAQLERINAHGLRGNWLSGRQLHDFMASLLGKTNVNDATGTGYFGNGDFQLYKYYNQNMTGHRVGTSPSGDVKFDVYATVDGSRAKMIFGARPSNTGTWQIQINSLSSLGLPTSGTVKVKTWGFPLSGGHYGQVNAPVDKGTVAHTYSGNTLTLAAYMTDATTAYSWEVNV